METHQNARVALACPVADNFAAIAWFLALLRVGHALGGEEGEGDKREKLHGVGPQVGVVDVGRW